MTPIEIMTSDGGEYLKFENVKEPRSARPDLHAFIILSELEEGTKDVLASAEHDEVWLSFDPDAVFKNMTNDQASDLIRCGVRYDPDYHAFCMFV